MQSMQIDPNKITVSEKKVLGLWPPADSLAKAIAPYLRRLKTENSTSPYPDVLDIGVGNGENIVYLFDNVPNIEWIYGLSHNRDYEDLILKNISDIPKVKRNYQGEMVDCILIDVTDTLTTSDLVMYYSKLNKGGYIVGNKHTDPRLKTVLNDFRKASKITVPIQVISKNYWMWKKP